MKKLGESLSDKESEDMMKQAGIDGDSRTSYIFQGCHEEVSQSLSDKELEDMMKQADIDVDSYFLHISGLP